MTSPNADKPGYKHTPVGWIPEEWEFLPFGSLVNDSEYGLSVGTAEDGTVPIIGMSHIQNGLLKVDSLSRVRISNAEYERYRICKNDLLFNRTNSADLVGKSVLIREDLPFVFASYLVRFRLKQNTYPEYIGYFFNASHVLQRIRNLATPGVSQYNINPTTLRKHLYIPLPPLPEQKKIAEILGTWDKAIEQQSALIEQKKLLKKGLMQQLLTGKMRFPQFGKPSKNGELPEGWKEVRLGEVAEIIVSTVIRKRVKTKRLCHCAITLMCITTSTSLRKCPSWKQQHRHWR